MRRWQRCWPRPCDCSLSDITAWACCHVAQIQFRDREYTDNIDACITQSGSTAGFAQKLCKLPFADGIKASTGVVHLTC